MRHGAPPPTSRPRAGEIDRVRLECQLAGAAINRGGKGFELPQSIRRAIEPSGILKCRERIAVGKISGGAGIAESPDAAEFPQEPRMQWVVKVKNVGRISEPIVGVQDIAGRFHTDHAAKRSRAGWHGHQFKQAINDQLWVGAGVWAGQEFSEDAVQAAPRLLHDVWIAAGAVVGVRPISRPQLGEYGVQILCQRGDTLPGIRAEPRQPSGRRFDVEVVAAAQVAKLVPAQRHGDRCAGARAQ